MSLDISDLEHCTLNISDLKHCTLDISDLEHCMLNIYCAFLSTATMSSSMPTPSALSKANVCATLYDVLLQVNALSRTQPTLEAARAESEPYDSLIVHVMLIAPDLLRALQALLCHTDKPGFYPTTNLLASDTANKALQLFDRIWSTSHKEQLTEEELI